MSKILAGYIMDGNSGGIDRYLLNFLDTVWIEGMQIDFLSDRKDTELEKRLKKYGSRIFPVASLKHPLKQYRQTKKIILENEYDIVYLNISTAIDCIGAKAARDCHVKEVLLHSHSGGNDCESELKRHLYNMFHAVCKTFFYRFGNRHYGCSKSAGYWMYPEKIVDSADFQVVYNAVDREQYQYDSAIRENVRREMGAEDSLILGHVGNFCYQKNHEFLMRVFAEVIKIRPDAQLWCLGRGVGYEKIVKLLLENGAEIDIKNKYKNTALYVAVREGHEGIVKRLLDKEANPNIQDQQRNTALHKAAQGGHTDIVELLLENWANPNIQNLLNVLLYFWYHIT